MKRSYKFEWKDERRTDPEEIGDEKKQRNK